MCIAIVKPQGTEISDEYLKIVLKIIMMVQE